MTDSSTSTATTLPQAIPPYAKRLLIAFAQKLVSIVVGVLIAHGLPSALSGDASTALMALLGLTFSCVWTVAHEKGTLTKMRALFWAKPPLRP